LGRGQNIEDGREAIGEKKNIRRLSQNATGNSRYNRGGDSLRETRPLGLGPTGEEKRERDVSVGEKKHEVKEMTKDFRENCYRINLKNRSPVWPPWKKKNPTKFTKVTTDASSKTGPFTKRGRLTKKKKKKKKKKSEKRTRG